MLSDIHLGEAFQALLDPPWNDANYQTWVPVLPHHFNHSIAHRQLAVTIYNMLALVLFLPGFIMTPAFITSKWVA